MKKISIVLVMSFCTMMLYAQKINRIVFTKDGQIEAIDVELPENVILKISKDGQITKWGMNRYAGHDDILREKLDDYVGRIDYFKPSDNEAFAGKVRSIGTIQLTYYASFDNPAYVGKLKSIGNAAFDYYTLQDNDAFKGNIKSIGSQVFQWYTTFDQADVVGKLKSVGNTAITYYTALDDKFIKGKVKSIGSSNYTYYTSFDQKELRGFMKSGQNLRLINGIRFMVRN